MVDKNKDDFDDDLLDDLDDDTPAVSKASAAEDKESAKSKLSKIFGKKKKIEQQLETPEENNNSDDLADSTPKVSMASKKNFALMGIIALIAFYFVNTIFLDDSKKKKKASNETQEMEEEYRDKSKVPDLSDKAAEQMEIKDEQIAQMQQLQQQSQNPVEAVDITAPPPPPPPTFATGSAYIEDLEKEGAEDEASEEDFEEEEDFEDEDFEDDLDEDLDTSGTGGTQSAGSAFTKSGGVLVRNKFGAATGLNGTTTGTDGLPQLGNTTGGTGGGAGVVDQSIQQQLNAPMLTTSSAENLQKDKEDEEKELFEFKLGKSGAQSKDVTTVGDLNNMILQGKVLDAVIETAINTDLPGKLRGIVARDVYAEKGKKIMIPKGSRLIGTYDTQVKFGQARVFIIWTRVIRPDGIDAMLDSREDMIATDLLGRSGVVGDIDNRFVEIFGSSILLSTITIAFSYAADQLTNAGQVTSTVTQDGNVVESGSTLALGTRQAVSDVGSKVQSIARDLINLTPRITIDQGTRIKVFVNKDIYFPPDPVDEQDGLMIIR